jgi:hypothetical protein
MNDVVTSVSGDADTAATRHGNARSRAVLTLHQQRTRSDVPYLHTVGCTDLQTLGLGYDARELLRARESSHWRNSRHTHRFRIMNHSMQTRVIQRSFTCAHSVRTLFDDGSGALTWARQDARASTAAARHRPRRESNLPELLQCSGNVLDTHLFVATAQLTIHLLSLAARIAADSHSSH